MRYALQPRLARWMVLMFVFVSTDTTKSQELEHFNTSSGTDFEKDNVFAEIVHVKATTASTTERDHLLTAPSPEIAANNKDTMTRTASWKIAPVGKIQVPDEVEISSESTVVTTTESVTTTQAKPTVTTVKDDTDHDDLQGNRPPYIRDPASGSIIYVEQNKSKTFECKADGEKPLTYTWYKNDRKIVQPFTNGTLKFANFLSRNNNGVYHCSVKNGFGVAVSAHIKILGVKTPDKADDPNVKSKTVHVGDFVILERGKLPLSVPPFITRWYISEDNREYTLTKGIGITEEGDLLNACVKEEDTLGKGTAAVFRVGLINPPELDSNPTIILLNERSLTVIDKEVHIILKDNTSPEAKVITNNPKAVLGQSRVLECFFSGCPVPTISWKNSSNHEIRENDPRYTIFDFGRKLKINSVTQDDQGDFSCTGSNTHASQKIAIHVNVTSPPIPTARLSTHIKPDGTDFTLKCESRAAYGQSVNQPIWYRNGKTLRDSSFPDPARYFFNNAKTRLTIKNLNKEKDTASYQCRVTNSEGELYMNGYLRVINSIEITKRPADVLYTRNGTSPLDLTVLARGDSCCKINRVYYFNNSILNDTTLHQPPFFKNDLKDDVLHFDPASVSMDVLKTWMGKYECRVSNSYQIEKFFFTIRYNDNPAPVAAKKSAMGLWWVGLLCGILAILIVIIIVIIIYKSNYPGDTYQLEKTELKHNLNPEADLLDQSFQEI